MRLLYFVANGFAATLDWVMGVFLVWAVGQLWPHELAWYHLALGAFLGILPDLDFIHRALFAKKGEGLTDHHDSLMHRPAFMLPLAAGLGYLLGGEFWAVAVPAPIFAHYLHDTRGLGGGGIGWLWPFSRKHYGISVGELGMVTHSPKLYGTYLELLITDPREASTLWPDHNKWLEEEYLRPSPRSVVELAWASCLLSIVAWGVVGVWAEILIYFGAWLTAFGLWRAFENISKRRTS